MTKLIGSLLVGALAALVFGNSAHADARLFILKRADGALKVEPIELREGEARVWRYGENGFIDVILPPGAGGSASVAQAAMSPVTEARLADGRLMVVTTAGGKRFERPVPTAAERALTDIHVSARDASGATLALFIRGDARVQPDPVGVVEDPFGEAIPLQPGDCVLFTSTFASRGAGRERVAGAAPVEFNGRHHLVPVSIPGAGSGRWVVDLAAGSSVVSRAMLPPGTSIAPAVSAQYSAEGVQRLAAEVGGATNAAAPLGYVVIPELRLGDLALRDVEALVMENLPPVAEGVTGILGLDVLSRASAVTLPFPREGERGEIVLGAAPTGERAVSVPIAMLGSRTYCRGSVNGAEVCFLIDTGAPRTVLAPLAAERAGVELTGDTTEVRGIGDQRVTLQGGSAGEVGVGHAKVHDTPVDVGALPLFSRFRGALPVGILGNSTLSHFRALTLDFEDERLTLWKSVGTDVE